MEKKYYLYHVPGIKIGATVNPFYRLHIRQGYNKNDYEILEVSSDIDYISKRELELQEQYGYKKDKSNYKLISKKMKVNPTEQTSTFAVSLDELAEHLKNNLNYEWETPQGYKFKLTKDNIKWIVQNANSSAFNAGRSYIYNRAFNEFLKNENKEIIKKEKKVDDQNYFSLIRQWANDRGLYDKGDVKTQYVKLQEEAGELARAIIKQDKPEIADSIGDMVVVLTNLAHLAGLTIEDCIASAYTVIKDRKGSMTNGSFVKQTL